MASSLGNIMYVHVEIHKIETFIHLTSNWLTDERIVLPSWLQTSWNWLPSILHCSSVCRCIPVPCYCTYFHCEDVRYVSRWFPSGSPPHQERVCGGSCDVLLQQTGEWGPVSKALWCVADSGVEILLALKMYLFLFQEEDDEDVLFKMVFVINMDLSMGVGKVSLVLFWLEFGHLYLILHWNWISVYALLCSRQWHFQSSHLSSAWHLC